MSGDPVLAALARLEEGQTKLREELAKLEEGQTTLREGLAKLEDGPSSPLQSGLRRLEDQQTRFRVELMDRMDRFENRLTTIQDDIGVNMGGVSTVFERVAATRKEGDATASMLQTVIRQVHRLQNEVEELKKRPA